MLRTFVMVGISMLLAFAALAACNGDDDDNDVTDDVPVLTDDDDDDDAVTDDDDDAVTDNDDDAVTGDDDDAVTDDDDDPAGMAADDDNGATVVEDTVDVVLTEYEIDMPDSVNAGIVAFALSNEGDTQHGIAIEESTDNGEIIAVMTVSAGEVEPLEIELESGDYTIFCPVGEHRDDHGMETTLTVE
jgi:uncharacterized cupredoxin-like copper-binding protein